MGANSAIEWTDHTFNPWWGCVKVSPACDFCYAEVWARRLGKQVWGKDAPRRFFSDGHWNEPLRWDRLAAKVGVRRRVFCASMADVFEQRQDLNPQRRRLWDLIDRTPNLDWLLLTKRPHNVMTSVPWGKTFPHNVWIGTTAENQQWYETRARHLDRIPAAVTFLSCEPLLGPIALNGWRLDWMIVGGESGRTPRAMEPLWARSLRDQCITRGIPFHFKQWGGKDKHAAGRELDGRTWDEFPISETSGRK